MASTYLEVLSPQDGDQTGLNFVAPLSSAGGLPVGMDSVIEDLTEVIVEQIPKIKIGICAMNKKTKSQPMQEILCRIGRFEFVEIIVFPDHVINLEPAEKWPLCDALISFYSTGFPLSKAITYANLRKPLVLNDLEMQYTLMDRCAIYGLLESADIETPRYAILMRDGNGAPIDTDFVELEDSIQIGNIVFQKPFVEKPIDAEDHNVFIYFPSSAGGGSQRLFRKVGSRSSIYSAESSVRKFGSYIYEDFVHTDGTDVKIYTVGPEYAHAEARKSPSLDGKVERDSQGKEIRYPVILNPYEKDIAHKVCKLFKQTVCGFDLLRTHGKSYVCDVNGFSFVKTSKKYYDDCAQVLVNCCLQELAPQLYKPYLVDISDNEDCIIADTLHGSMLELRCVVGIIRHGDRTPKQKMKMEVRHPLFLQLFKKYSNSTDKKLKLKRPKQLQEVLDIARGLLEDADVNTTVFESSNKLHQLKNVLEMYGHFSGINRKIQFKYLGRVRESSENSGEEEKQKKESVEEAEKRVKDKESKEEEALLLIMKWGGELTQTGRVQAEELGKAFRCMYPGGDGAYSSLPGGGLLRLHSTYRHDLKIYASDEGRVQMTAAAFAKGFLALEGELTPILVHLVRSDKNTTEMLDTSDQATKHMGRAKHKLHDIMRVDRNLTDEDMQKLAPTKVSSLLSGMKHVQNPRQMCAKLSGLVHSLTRQLKDMVSNNVYNPRDPFLYHEETLELMTHRWNKLDKDFKLKNGMYDISLIPDIYDSIKYDIQHSSNVGLEKTQELYACAKALADIVIPQEYGLTAEEKVKISQKICQRLLRKIQGDLQHADVTDTFTRLNPKYSQSVISPHRHVRTRLYFTSESHVHSVVNAMRYGTLIEDEKIDFQWRRALEFLSGVSELNYMTQIVFMLYEDPTAEKDSDKRFHLELHFSPGALGQSDHESHEESAKPKSSRPLDPELPTPTATTTPSADYDSIPHDVPHGTKPTTHVQLPTIRPGIDQTDDILVETQKEKGANNSSDQVQTTIHSTKPGPTVDQPYKSTLYQDDKTDDYTVDAGNERSRCAIGMDDDDDDQNASLLQKNAFQRYSRKDSSQEELPDKDNIFQEEPSDKENLQEEPSDKESLQGEPCIEKHLQTVPSDKDSSQENRRDQDSCNAEQHDKDLYQEHLHDKEKCQKKTCDKGEYQEEPHDKGESQEEPCDKRESQEEPCDKGKSQEEQHDKEECQEEPHDKGECQEEPCDKGKFQEEPCDKGKFQQEPCDKGKFQQEPHDKGECQEESHDKGECQEEPCDKGECHEEPHDKGDRQEEPRDKDYFPVVQQNTNRRHRSLDAPSTSSFARTSSESDAVPCGMSNKHKGTRMTFSDSDISHEKTKHQRVSPKPCLDQQQNHEQDYRMEPELRLKNPSLQRSRSVSASCLEGTEYFSTREARSTSDSGPANDDQKVKCSQSAEALDLQSSTVTSKPSAKSDTIVLVDRGQITLSGTGKFPLRVIHSSPPRRPNHSSTGTLFYLPAIRAVTKKLSLAVHGTCAYRVRPLSMLKSRKPPLAQFYDEVLSPVSSIHPLLTLHDDIRLNDMEAFLKRMTGENGESDLSSASTPVTTPTRQTPKKRLSLKASTHKQLLTNNDSFVGLEGLDVNELKG